MSAVAVWEDGTREDVTPLCRFQTNDDEIAQIDAAGQVTAGKAGDTHVVVFYDIGVQPVPVLHPVSSKTGSQYPAVPTPTKIDELVVAKLSKLGIVPSGLCTDDEFLRRVSLDLTGTLPTPAEVTAFRQRHESGQAGPEDRAAAGDPGLRRLVDHAAVRLYRQQRYAADERRTHAQRAGQPGLVRLDLQAGAGEQALR